MTGNADATVLVVDDDDGLRDSMVALLESAGFSVRASATALDFLDGCKSVGIGCAVVDVGLPDMNGLVLQEVLAKQGISLPVVIVTGNADVPTAVKAMRAGAVDFLEKPYSDEALIASIERAIALSRTAHRTAAGPAAAYRERIARLTPRERDVMRHLVAGQPNKIIAYELGISPRTVELHRARVMEKMEAASLPDLVRFALAAGIGPD